MPIDAATLEALIREGIPGAIVQIEDVRGDGECYAAHVVAAQFAGLSRIQQHQMVYRTLQKHLDKDLRALHLSTSER